jgi:hypothetical protein
MAKGSFLQSLGLIFAAMACTDQTSDYRGRTAQPATQGEELDASASPTQNTQRPESETGPQTNPKPVVTPTPTTTPVPAPLNAAQASALVRGSCIFAGCHADGPTLMAAPSILIQLRDNLMPPPNQQRYTLRSADRAALLAYLQNRSPAALAD